eukprot:4188344-Ditylum_brightwellii.AAC.1
MSCSVTLVSKLFFFPMCDSLSIRMFASIAMVSQLSAKEDFLNWQLRINVAKAWMMVGALTICCKKLHVS